MPVDGLTCEGCAETVTWGLAGLDGVAGVEVDVSGGTATVTGRGDVVRVEAVRARIEELGFDVRDDEEQTTTRTLAFFVLAALAILGGGFYAFP
jgi:copper chaperone